MTQPTVAAVMLVSGRDAMVRRAVECFEAQTYEAKTLHILDTGDRPVFTPELTAELVQWVNYEYRPDLRGLTIGELRNAINLGVGADIIVHFDSDDWSHPRRVEEQVALLEASGADAVGYNEALFWRETAIEEDHNCEGDPCCAPEAWLYSNGDATEMLGASLCYWRKTWERKPFAATSQGEDFRFRVGLRTVGTFAFQDSTKPMYSTRNEARFVARIHAGNTSNAYRGIENASEWRRGAEWDAYCRERMAL